MSAPTPFVFESGQRLSQSRIWALQRAYFTQAGMDAWASATVPHYVTCNAFIADAYARVVMGWLRDGVAAGLVDRAHPVYLTELGAGSGQFAYLFLAALESMLERSSLKELRVTYVLTDFSDESLGPWRRHPSLRPLVDAGRLDFARYDVEHDDRLELVESGVTLSAGGVVNPMVVLANYFFDSIPQDAFWVGDGEFYECLVRLSTPTEELDPDDASILTRVTLSYDDRPARADYYGDTELDRLLAVARTHVTKGSVRFPTAGVRCCRVFSGLTGDRWLLVSGDKGFVEEEALDGRDRPGIAVHGSFSMDVNYHAIAEFFRGRQGQVMTMDHRHNSLNVVAMALGGGASLETLEAYSAHVASFGPDDFFVVSRSMEARAESLTLPETLALLRLGRCDPQLLRKLLPRLRALAPAASAIQKRDLLRIVDRACALHFHIGERFDLPFAIGVLLVELAAFDRALAQFARSWAGYGADVSTAYNVALASYRLKRRDEARAWAAEALAIDGVHRSTLILLDEMDEERASTA